MGRGGEGVLERGNLQIRVRMKGKKLAEFVETVLLRERWDDDRLRPEAQRGSKVSLSN